ncbi:hypothetical protein Tco_0114977 [Tanacetum coccineum]
MGDEHLSTIPEKESDEVIKSSVENLVPIPSESEDLSDNVSECDVPVCDDSPETNFTTFSNPIFDSNDDFTSSDDESLPDEDAPKENFKIYSNSLFKIDEGIISSEIDPLYNEIDYLLEEFSGELAHIDLIPPGIDEADFDLEEDIHLIEELLYENSSPRPPKELDSAIPDAIIESFSPSPIPVEDSDSLMEEIDIFLAFDDSIPPGINYDSEGDVLFLEELLNDNSISPPEYESFHVDLYNVPSSRHPPEKPPNDIEPDPGKFDYNCVSFPSRNRNKVFDPGIFIEVQSKRFLSLDEFPHISFIRDPLSLVFDTLLPFSSENEDKVFTPGILASKEEKSPCFLSHRGFKAFKIINDLSKSPMMISGEDIPILDVSFLYFYPL